MRIFYTFLFSAACLAAGAQQTFLVEHFDYPAGAPLTMHGWTAHSASGTSPILVSEQGLSMQKTMYAGNNLGRAALVINNGSDENKPFNKWVPQPAEGQPAAHTYASFMIKPNGPIPPGGIGASPYPYFFHFAQYSNIDNPVFTSISTAFRARTFILPGTEPNTFRLNLSFNQNEPDSTLVTGNLNAAETHLIVVKYSSVPGANNDLVSLFVFKDGEDISKEPEKPTIGPLTGTSTDITVQAIALRQYMPDQNVIVDGIIVRDHWDLTSPATSTRDRRFIDAFKVFPNPAPRGFINLSTGEPGSMLVRVHDVSGKVLLQQWVEDGLLDISRLQKGMYVLHAMQDNRNYSHKIIVH